MSRTFEADSEFGEAVPPLLLPRTVLLPIVGNCPNVDVPEISPKLGCVELGTPPVDIALIH
jgi:hypothetical protein